MSFPDCSLAVTVVIPTLNEADRLPACLESVRWAVQVIVADAGSTDDTVLVAQRAGATVIRTPGMTIGMQRNAAIDHATCDWVLCLDADERASAALAAAIAAMLERPTASAYCIPFRNRYLGAPMARGGWGRDRHVRLARATQRWNTQQVHERLLVDGPVAPLGGWIDHDSYRDLDHQLTKVQRYAANGARDLAARDTRVGFGKLFLRPIWRFARLYVVEGAWRDGSRGFILSVVHAWSAFAKYALLWDRQRILRDQRQATVLSRPRSSASAPVTTVVPSAAPTIRALPDAKLTGVV